MKIGYIAEKVGVQGRGGNAVGPTVKYRPLFVLSEAFTKTYGLENTRKGTPSLSASTASVP